jgi:crossover junction endodeoxyribonuclease RusA
MKLADAKKNYRFECAWSAKSQGLGKIDAKKLHLSITFYPKSKRKYDLDNALASLKSGFDGIADVVGVDDSEWSFTIKKGDSIGGFVDIEIEVVN